MRKMKKQILIFLGFLATQVLMAQDFNNSMAYILKSMKTYTLEVVDQMPEDTFDYKPTDSVRTFRQQVQHIIGTNHFLLNHYLKGNAASSLPDDLRKSFFYAEKTTKMELMELLGSQFDETVTFLENASKDQYSKTFTFGTPEAPEIKDYFTAVMLVRDHISHHRAQLVLYLRFNNITPVQYRGF